MTGNSRLHWALGRGTTLLQTWHSPHPSTPIAAGELEQWLPANINLASETPLYLASVVGEQTAYWQNLQQAREIALDRVPLRGAYPTFGIDRALAVYGAGIERGFPALVVDAGTALTLTGVNRDRELIGGAIWPGLSLQARSLGTGTSALPEVLMNSLSAELPPRWARSTEVAIRSGILYAVAAGVGEAIADWWQHYPSATVVLTGGDASSVHAMLCSRSPELAAQLAIDRDLVLRGLAHIVGNESAATPP
ncbi:pantothenate kinase [Rubidibacter lacunae]|uniref:pantothenate kinase n=1 Tax=Rubidibacter lacunae TaxID=582514 RepID=UPI00068653EA|nr:pantothenate kinase [Rubidibacter lacunae]